MKSVEAVFRAKGVGRISPLGGRLTCGNGGEASSNEDLYVIGVEER